MSEKFNASSPQNFFQQTMTEHAEYENSTTFWQDDAAYAIGVYGMLLLMPLGVLSNLLAFMVFGRLHPQSTTTSYLQALAVADLISLSWDTVVSTALPLLNVNLLTASYWTCKFGIWFDMSSSIVASCALMVVAIDRVTLMWFGSFHKRHCSRGSVSVAISVGLWLITLAYCSPLMYFYELDDSGRACALSTTSEWKTKFGLQFVTFITYGPYFAIPASVIIFANVVIIRKLCRRRRNRRRRLGMSTRATTAFADKDDIPIILITDCVSFLSLIGLAAVLWATCWTPANDKRQRAVYGLVFVIAQFISCVEESIDLFLYLACSGNFRRTFMKLIYWDRIFRIRPSDENRLSDKLSTLLALTDGQQVQNKNTYQTRCQGSSV